MNFRWISNTRQSMQRLGYCKAVVLEDMIFQDGNELKESLKSLLNSEVSFSANDNIIQCLNSIPKIEKYDTVTEDKIHSYLQYYYICTHPSQSGWLSRVFTKEYAEGLPKYLGLLDEFYRLTDFGFVLQKGLISKEEVFAFHNLSVDINPLVLNISQKVFFLYNIISNDGDFFIPFVNTLSKEFTNTPFSYLDAGNLILEVLRDMFQRFSSTGYSSDDRKRISDLKSAIVQVEKAIKENIEKQGSVSRREQTTIPRLEWLIDLGFAEKISDPGQSRLYRFTDYGHRFAKLFYVTYSELEKTKYIDEVIATILDKICYRNLFNVYNNQENPTIDSEINNYLFSAYAKMKGVSGYCVVRPLLLLANSLRIEKNQGVIDYVDVKEKLKQAYLNNPSSLYYTTTRDGKDIQLIFN